MIQRLRQWLWLPGRQAREAVASGRPDHARDVLEPHVKSGHRKAMALLPEVAAAFVARAERRLRDDHAEAAWDDLQEAESIAPTDDGAAALRATLTKLAVATCRAAFLAGNPSFVRDAITKLKPRNVTHPAFDWLEPAAGEWLLARDHADEGDFSAAAALLDRARTRIPPDAQDGLVACREDVARRFDRSRTVIDQLYEAVESKRWRDVHRLADEVLAVAPDNIEARKLKARGWDELQRTVNDMAGPAPPGMSRLSTVPGMPTTPRPDSAVPLASVGPPKRLVLWIDNVGGFLLLLNPRVSLGAESNPANIDVPCAANLARVHAEIMRDEEGGYLVAPSKGAAVSVNGAPVTADGALKDGDRLTLGTACQLLFHLPNDLSTTARLTPASDHRIAGSSAAVLLMGETLMLGPDDDAHVRVPGASGEIKLYRTPDGLGVTAEGAITVGDHVFQNNVRLPVPCRVHTEPFTFAVEVYDPRR